MTDCLHLPDEANCWECHSRCTCTWRQVDESARNHAHTSNSYVDAQVYSFFKARKDRVGGQSDREERLPDKAVHLGAMK